MRWVLRLDDWRNMVGWLSGRDENDGAKEFRTKESKRKMRREGRNLRLRVGTYAFTTAEGRLRLGPRAQI